MKKCAYCGKEYPDDATVCVLDAQDLVDPNAPEAPKPRPISKSNSGPDVIPASQLVTTAPSNTPEAEPSPLPSPPKTGRRRLVLVAVAFIGLSIAGALLWSKLATPAPERFMAAIRQGNLPRVRKMLDNGFNPLSVGTEMILNEKLNLRMEVNTKVLAQLMVINKMSADQFTLEEIQKLEDPTIRDTYTALHHSKGNLQDFQAIAALLEAHPAFMRSRDNAKSEVRAIGMLPFTKNQDNAK